MLPGERFRNWISDTAAGFADRLTAWGMVLIGKGVTRFTDDLEPGMIDIMRDTLTRFRDAPGVPQEYKDIIDKSLETGDIGRVIFGWITTVLGVVMSVLSWGSIPARVVGYEQDRVSKTFRLDPISIITAWRRDPEKYKNYFEDLRDQGWDEDRIEALKFFTQFYPAPADLVRWQAREVFEPDMIARYGLDDELGAIERDPFYKAGMTDEQITNYWRAHWEHASWIQVVEMLRRGQLEERDVWDWFRLVEIPPFWRQKLINISWEVPTRVDVRRFWDMRTIDEARLREIYGHHGYHGKDLDDYVLWTKVYVAFPDLMTRYKNGWLTIGEVRDELIKLGMPPDRVDEMIETKVKAETSEKLTKQKDLTMSQIVKGVKKAVISRDQGMLLLQDLGYDPYEAAFILAIEIPQDEVVTEVEIRELTKADVLSGLKAMVITREEARIRLLGLRYTATDVNFLLKIYDAQVKPPVETKLKEASKADIVKAVKMGLITPEVAYLMLQDIDYSPESAEFILLVHAEETPFSPMSFNEYKELTYKWRTIVTPPGKLEPEELRATALELIQQTKDVEALKQAIKDEEAKLLEEETLPEETTKRLDELRLKLHRAEAERQRLQTDYNIMLAEWRQTLP